MPAIRHRFDSKEPLVCSSLIEKILVLWREPKDRHQIVRGLSLCNPLLIGCSDDSVWSYAYGGGSRVSACACVCVCVCVCVVQLGTSLIIRGQYDPGRSLVSVLSQMYSCRGDVRSLGEWLPSDSDTTTTSQHTSPSNQRATAVWPV
jgi:hypothetical protein